MHSRTIGVLCILIVCVLLTAGLWPFHTPTNDVSWLSDGDGLHFGGYGSILSSGSFPVQMDKTNGTMEVWLEPGMLGGRHTILSFDGSAHSGTPFSLLQHEDTLIVQQDNEDTTGTSWTAWCMINGLFRTRTSVFLTITLGPRQTTVYVNGGLSKQCSVGDSSNNFTGRLVVANSPNSSDSWSGTIKGLAIYKHRLTQDEVLDSHESWVKKEKPNLTPGEIALYLFNEHSGDTVHNEFDPRTDLKIPSHYFVLHSAFLSPPWRGYHPSWSYWEDFTVNIVGFVPFGFFAEAYFSSVRQKKRAAAITVVMGFLISLLIETLQAFLPTRDSGMNDLVTNTLGTAVGVLLCNLSWSQQMLKQSRVFSKICGQNALQNQVVARAKANLAGS